MKVLLTSLLLTIGLVVQSQDLRNSEWVQIKAELLDGSRIIYPFNIRTAPIKFLFTTDSVYDAIDNQYVLHTSYSIGNNILTIGYDLKYHIDSCNGIFLYISQVQDFKLPAEKFYKYVLINSNYLYDYAKRNNELTIVGDTLVDCNFDFSPTYVGDLGAIFGSENLKTLRHINSASTEGSFTIGPDGSIRNVDYNPVKEIPESDIDEIVKTIYSTKGQWVLPPTPKALLFKIYFHFTIDYNHNLRLTEFNFKDGNHETTFSNDSIQKANAAFNEGVIFLKKNKYESAISKFIDCGKIDSTNIDMLYDLAYCYEQDGKKDMACSTWKKLMDLGQVEGADLYKKNCR